MSKDKISDYSQTANSNTDIGGINVDEGCAPSGINDAIRTLMKQLKDWQSGSQDVYIHPAGSASVPSITATGDTNTGIFFPAADTVGITTGGTERARVDSSGNLGLGVTPSAWGASFKSIDINTYGAVSSSSSAFRLFANSYGDGTNWVYKTTAAATRYEMSGGAYYWFTAPSGTAGNAISFTQAMTLDASGYLGIGVTSPQYWLDVRAANLDTSGFNFKSTTGTNAAAGRFNNTGGNFYIGLDNSAGNRIGNNGAAYAGAVWHEGAYPLIFGTSNTERARIDSSGNLLVGKTAVNTTNTGLSVDANFGSGGGGVRVVNSISTSSADGFQMYSTGASAFRFFVSFAGQIYATNTSISAISDIRFKENVRDLNVGLAEVLALKPRLYDWKKGKGADIKNARGFIAQEFEEVFPDLIDEWRDPAPEGEEPYKSVRQDLIPVLVKAIQEQQAIITQLQADVAALKGQA